MLDTLVAVERYELRLGFIDPFFADIPVLCRGQFPRPLDIGALEYSVAAPITARTHSIALGVINVSAVWFCRIVSAGTLTRLRLQIVYPNLDFLCALLIQKLG